MTTLVDRTALTLEDAQDEARTTGQATILLALGHLLVRHDTEVQPGELRYDWINDPRPEAATVTVYSDDGRPIMRSNFGQPVEACYLHGLSLTEDEARKLAEGKPVGRLTVALRRAAERSAHVHEVIEANRLTAPPPSRSVSGVVGLEPHSMLKGVPLELRRMGR